MTAGEFDDIVATIYDAAAGRAGWRDAFDPLARRLDAWSVRLIGVDKRTSTLLFSHEGGAAPPLSTLNYLRAYHLINPRIAPLLALDMQSWIRDYELFDEDIAVSGRTFGDYALGAPGRILTGTKIFDDGNSVVLFGLLRECDKPAIGPLEFEVLGRIKSHLTRALEIHRYLQATASLPDPGVLLLNQFRQPMLVVDENRGIRFRNHAAEQMLERSEHVLERNGVLVCRRGQDDALMADAMRALRLVDPLGHSMRPPDRKLVRVHADGSEASVAVFLLALRPQVMLGAFGDTALALLVFHDARAQIELDPFIVGEAFDLTPAEAKVAVQLAQGKTPELIAADHNVSIATVRSQIKALFGKTGTNRQTDLVRILVALPDLGSPGAWFESAPGTGGSGSSITTASWSALG